MENCQSIGDLPIQMPVRMQRHMGMFDFREVEGKPDPMVKPHFWSKTHFLYIQRLTKDFGHRKEKTKLS